MRKWVEVGCNIPHAVPKNNAVHPVLHYFTEDKPKTDRGAVIETRCKQREGREEKKVKKKTKTWAGRQAENPGSNERQITSRVTQFIFQTPLHG